MLEEAGGALVEVGDEEVLFCLGGHGYRHTYLDVYYGFVIICYRMRLTASDIFLVLYLLRQSQWLWGRKVEAAESLST